MLANHVRQFTLSLSMTQTHADVPKILKKLGRLEKLEVNGKARPGGQIQWTYLSVPLKDALTTLIVEAPDLR